THPRPELGATEGPSGEIRADIGGGDDEDRPDETGKAEPGIITDHRHEGHGETDVEDTTRKPRRPPGRHRRDHGGADEERRRPRHLAGEARHPDPGHRGGRHGDENRRDAASVTRHHAVKFPEHQHRGEARKDRHPDAAHPEVEGDDGGEGDARNDAEEKLAEPPSAAGRRGRHPATAPNRRSRRPKPRTSAANMSAVKSGQRTSTKEYSE